MYIDLNQLHPYIVALLPILASFIAGVLRQDKFPKAVNEIITYLVILAIALFQAFTDGKLGGSPLATFGLVAAYVTALMHTSYGQQLQQVVQSNVLSLGKPAPVPQPAPTPTPAQVDIPTVAGQVMTYIQRQQMMQQPTNLMPAMPPQPVRTNTPPPAQPQGG